MIERRRAGQDGEDGGPPEAPGADHTVVRFPDRMRRRQPGHPVSTDDADGPDPGPSAA